MAGCFGNHPFDRQMERELMRHLDQEDDGYDQEILSDVAGQLDALIRRDQPSNREALIEIIKQVLISREITFKIKESYYMGFHLGLKVVLYLNGKQKQCNEKGSYYCITQPK